MSDNQINTTAKYIPSNSRRRFKPTLKLSLFSLILFIILVYLGRWQMHKATYKKNISYIVQQKSQNSPVVFSTITKPSLAENRFTAVSFKANFLNNFTFLLDNQMHQHKVGFRVLTVAEIVGHDTWVLIDRGWVAAGTSRKQLPVIVPAPNSQELIGMINNIPTGIILQKDKFAADSTAPYVIQSLDYDLISQLLQHEIFNFVVQLRNDTMTNYTIPELSFGISSNKHMAYAIQWYSFAGLVLVYYLITAIKKEFKRK